MTELFKATIPTSFGQKEIGVYSGDVMDFPGEIDILTTSAFKWSYAPTPGTLFQALHKHGVSVSELAKNPALDLRDSCNVWLSQEFYSPSVPVRRIGCVELVGIPIRGADALAVEQSMIQSIRAYFSMLDIGAIYDVRMETVALPLLGSGCQRISGALMIVPLLNECITFLKRNAGVKRILFIEKNEDRAALIADYVNRSYNVIQQNSVSAEPRRKQTHAFISYSSADKNIADNLCAKLESRGIRVWYAPRDVRGAYAESIVQAVDQSTHFIVILSQNSMQSQHVLNEIDLAFQQLPSNIRFKPLRIDLTQFSPSIKYYLSRQHWMDAVVPPLEERLNEFADSILADI